MTNADHIPSMNVKQPRQTNRSVKNKPRNRDEFGARVHLTNSNTRPKHRNQMFSMSDD